MPLHDWTKVPAGLFHHFHQVWSVGMARTLNRGLLPEGLSALVELRSGSAEGDVLVIEDHNTKSTGGGGVTVLEKPRTRIIRESDKQHYAAKANRITIRHRLGKIVAMIEIVSPGNKDSQRSLQQFVTKIADALYQGIHVLVIDLFPPTTRDPAGIHQIIWNEIEVEEFAIPADENRVLASYESASVFTAYIETVQPGSVLPSMPLFIAPGTHILVPLEATYEEAWLDTPVVVREQWVPPLRSGSS